MHGVFASLYSATAPQGQCSGRAGAMREPCRSRHPRWRDHATWGTADDQTRQREEQPMVSGAAVRTTAPSAGIDAFNIPNLLAGLAWLREASIDHIRRLWFPNYSVTGLRK